MSDEKSKFTVSVGGVSVTTSDDGRTRATVGGFSHTSQSQSLGGSHSLAALGIQVQKTAQSAGVSSGGVALTNSEVTRYDMRLPAPTGLHASFRKESWGDALVKIFKKELQTGDPEFDKLVYVSTDTMERTRAFLTPEVQKAIAFTIDMGGTLEINDQSVTAVSGGIDAPGEDDKTIVLLASALVAFASSPAGR